MNNPELDKLLLDIRELKQSVRKANPFLRDLMVLRAYWIMSFPLGIILLADCLVTHFLVKAAGSFAALPLVWKIITLAVFILTGVIGSAIKWIVVGRRAAKLKNGGNYLTVIEAMYGGKWLSLSGPMILSMGAVSAYFLLSGQPWLIVSILAVFLGPFCNVVSQLIDRREYLYTGWYATVAGLVSMFFIQSAPFIWLAIVWAGIFFVFGATGLAANRADLAGSATPEAAPGEKP